jgi:hypothetical protein
MPGATHTEERQSIERLKYAYFRLLDTKRFDDLGDLLTDDVTTSYEAGKYRPVGRAAVVEFLESSLGDPGIITVHHGHHPEITVADDGTATGVWYLEDRVIAAGADFELGGTALYTDRYRRDGDSWRISHTGYERIFEEQRTYSTGKLLSLTSRFDPAPTA